MIACTDFVTFDLDMTLYGIPVDRVQEILDVRPIAPMPNAPSRLLGIIDLRGDNVPVVDMRTLLGMSKAPDTPQTRILVVLMRRGDSEAVIGLRTDRVIEVTRLDGDDLRPLAEGQFMAWDGLSVLGIGRRNGVVISVIDLDGLFSGVAQPAVADAASAMTEQAA